MMLNRIIRTDNMVEWAGPHGGRIVVREQVFGQHMIGVMVSVPWGALDFVDLMHQALLWKEVLGLHKLIIETTTMAQVQALRQWGFKLDTESVISTVQLPGMPEPAAEAGYAPPPQEPTPDEEEVGLVNPPSSVTSPKKVAKRRIVARVKPAPAPVRQATTGVLPFAQHPRLQTGPVLEEGNE